jgi:transcription elongation factor GreA
MLGGGIPMTDTPIASKPVLLTRAGLQLLQQQVQALRDVKRPELVAYVRRASLLTDPDQSAADTAALRADLEALDRLIAEREAALARAEVVAEPSTSTVQLGSRVTIRYDDGMEDTLTLVSPFEAALTPGYVSSESPAGQALLGKAAGADVTVGTGDDAVSLAVVAIGKPAAPVDASPGAEH